MNYTEQTTMDTKLNIHLVHSTRVVAPKSIGLADRTSIADRCLIFGTSRWTVARQYGVPIAEINEICDVAMFERGRRAGRNEAKFFPPMGVAA
jgi:hypothetical protein